MRNELLKSTQDLANEYSLKQVKRLLDSDYALKGTGMESVTVLAFLGEVKKSFKESLKEANLAGKLNGTFTLTDEEIETISMNALLNTRKKLFDI